MNNINQKQNEERILKYQFSQRTIYSKCKMIKHITLCISIIVYLLGIIPYVSKNIGQANSVISSFWVILVFIIEYRYKKMKNKAVDYQEYIDRYLFEFNINKDSITNFDNLERESIELKLSHKDKYLKAINPNYKFTVYNWYSDVSGLPLDIARIVCQNENGRWENRQRKLYSWILGIILFFIFIISVVKAYIFSENIINLVYVIPIATEFIKLFIDNMTTIKLADEIENRIEEVYRHIEIKTNSYDKIYLKEQSSAIQKRIRDYRENSISVPEFFYNILKSKEQIKSNDFIKLKANQMKINLNRD